MEPFYVSFGLFFDVSSASVVQENAATLVCCEAPEKSLVDNNWLSISMWASMLHDHDQMKRLNFSFFRWTVPLLSCCTSIIMELRLTARCVCLRSQPVADQLVLECRDPPADVHVRDGLDEERPLLDAEALHLALSLVLLTQQQPQLAVAVQVDVGASGVRRGFDADGEAGGGRGHHVGSEVDDDGARGVEPLQGALRAAQVHLLHVSGVAFMSQTAGKKEKEWGEPTSNLERSLWKKMCD